MANRPPVNMPKLTPRSRLLLIIAGVLLLVLLIGGRLIGAYVDWLWFGEVEARGVFTTVLLTRLALFFLVGLFVAGAVWLGFYLAYRHRPVFVPVASQEDPLARYRSTVIARIRLFSIGIPAFIGLIAGAAAQSSWETVQLFFNGGDFGRQDPQFGKDVGFYVFDLPFYNWAVAWVFVAVGASFVAAAVAHYLFGGVRMAGRGPQLTTAARVQLAVTAGIFVLFKALEYFLDRYNTLLQGHSDLFTGASYTDLQAVMPAKLILTSIAVICAIALFAGAFMRNLVLPAIALVLLLVSSILVGWAWPQLLQRFSVTPNAIVKEQQPIERNMTETRFAYGLDNVDYIDYDPKSTATVDEITAEKDTISKIRLLDPSVLEPTFTQRVAKENIYGFPEKLDIDRYIDPKTGEVQDFIVAARELKVDNLDAVQSDWLNQRLRYTHGNGFVMAPANTIDRAPDDAGSSSESGYPVARRSDTKEPKGTGIEVTQPRIYFGELGNKDADYAIVGNPEGSTSELDSVNVEAGDKEANTHRYEGTGGVPIDSFTRRLLFMTHYGERNILFNTDIGDGSKIMYNRDPRTRVEKKAPWLTVDGDPYPAVIDGRITWIIDGYTTTANFPYGQKTHLGEATQDTLTGVVRHANDPISYIRNSVKATVDAYDGKVTLYAMDDKEPVLNAWQKVFPGVVQPSSAIPEELRAHFRYPEDMFKVQRDLITMYHVSTPQEYFSRSGWWSVPANPTTEASGNQPPYYLLLKGPGDEKPTFQLTSVLNPLRRDYLSAWMTVSSDPGTYGKIKVLRVPADAKESQPQGPSQVQKNFDQLFAQERTLFNNPDVDIIKGNQLTLPVAGGFLYVEPIYIQQRRGHGFPQLARVLVSFGNKLGYASTLPEAMDQAFGKGAGSVATGPEHGGDTPVEPAKPGDKPKEPVTGPPVTPGDADDAAREMQEAAAALFEARRNGDYEAEAQALADLEAAYQKYEEASKDGGR